MDRNKKEGRYSRVFEQLEQLVVPVKNPMSRMATIVAVLHHKFDYFFWTGFYLLENSHDLVVGPYQGTVACMRLKQHTGVCWAGIDSHKPVIVGDVERFPGHIACSSLSKSEIVIPVFNNNEISGVLDVDSKALNSFDVIDEKWLTKICNLIYLT